MGFTMGRNRGIDASKGEIRNKHKFKKGNNNEKAPGVTIIRKDLDKGVMGEANNDGTIFINKMIPKGCDFEKKVIRHEMKHMVDMKTGKLGYSDNHVKWNGKKYARKDGKINYKGKWIPEGSKKFPWEKH